MLKRFGFSILAFWLGIVLAIIAGVAFGFKFGLVVFIISTLTAIGLIFWAALIDRRVEINRRQEQERAVEAREKAILTNPGATTQRLRPLVLPRWSPPNDTR